MQKSLTGVYATDAGSLGVWDLQSFAQVDGYDAWEQTFGRDDDFVAQIQRGRFVPVGLHQPIDGSFAVEVRVGAEGQPALDARETPYVLARSQPFRLSCSGTLCVGGIEHVEADPSELVGRLELSPGDYSVEVCLVAWADEPGMRQADGSPHPDALPDFIVSLRPAREGEAYRVSCFALDAPGAI